MTKGTTVAGGICRRTSPNAPMEPFWWSGSAKGALKSAAKWAAPRRIVCTARAAPSRRSLGWVFVAEDNAFPLLGKRMVVEGEEVEVFVAAA